MLVSGQFNDSLAPIMDGVAICAQNYAYWLNENHGPSFAVGPKVPNFIDSDQNILRYRSLPLYSAGPYRLGVPWIDRSFNLQIDTIPFDIVHAHCPFVSGNYALSIARKRKIPLVATFHSKYRDDFAKRLHNQATLSQITSMVAKFYDQADSVWIPNEAIIDTLREYGYSGPVEFVPNGSDLAADSNEDIETLKREGLRFLHCEPEKPVLLFVGQQRWIKNIRLIVEALKELVDKHVRFQMRFVGDGSDMDSIQQLVRKYSLHHHVAFTGPVYDRDLLKKIYAAADLFIFPSLYDNASLATREAAGFGIPTLFIEGATTAHGVADNVNGFLSKNDPALFSRRIEQLLSDPDHLKKVGRGAKEYLYLPWERIASMVYEKYIGIVDRFKFEQLRKIS